MIDHDHYAVLFHAYLFFSYLFNLQQHPISFWIHTPGYPPRALQQQTTPYTSACAIVLHGPGGDVARVLVIPTLALELEE